MINYEYDIQLPEFVFIGNFNKIEIDNINKLVDKTNYISLFNKVINGKNYKENIVKYINENYVITNDDKDRKKISDLQEEINKNIRLFDNDRNNLISYIKTNLSEILKDLGLNKKRYSDGIYWYGLNKIKK